MAIQAGRDEGARLVAGGGRPPGLADVPGLYLAPALFGDVRPDMRLAGYIWINGSSRHFTGVPFGGTKLSGTGREEGLDELLSYTQVKTINVMLGANG